MTTIEETYRIVDCQQPDRERGLVAITHTLQENCVIANTMRLMLLPPEGLPEGDYGLQFVKVATVNRHIPRRSFPRLVVANDRGES